MDIANTKIGTKEIIIFIACVVATIALAIVKADIWTIISVLMVLFLLGLCLQDIYKNAFFFFFLASFFIFLMSGDIVELFFDKKYYIQFGESANKHAHICICISIISIGIGYILTSNKKKNVNFGNNSLNTTQTSKIKIAAKLVYCCTYPIYLFNTVDKLIFVMQYGYVASYTSYNPFLPSVIAFLGDMTPVALCFFLATFPSKKEASPIVISYLLGAFLGFFIGGRGTLVYNTIFILGYYMYRNRTDRGHTIWISKKVLLIMVCSVPFLLVFLFLYEYIRTGREIVFNSIGDSLTDFFVNIGSASKIIKYGYEYKDIIPKGKFYSIGKTLNYFKYGKLFNLFSSSSIPAAHTVEYALEAHSFGSYISYITMKEQYLAGQGAGASFIAILYADFGYIGVFLGSIIYGAIFKKMTCLNSNNCISAAIKLYIFIALLKAPRAEYDDFLAYIVSISFVATMVLICMVANLLNVPKPNNTINKINA